MCIRDSLTHGCQVSYHDPLSNGGPRVQDTAATDLNVITDLAWLLVRDGRNAGANAVHRSPADHGVVSHNDMTAKAAASTDDQIVPENRALAYRDIGFDDYIVTHDHAQRNARVWTNRHAVLRDGCGGRAFPAPSASPFRWIRT